MGRDWHVLVIGGPSGVGKTTLSSQLRRAHDVNCVEIDDLYAAARALTALPMQPERDCADAPTSTEGHLERLIATAEQLAPAVDGIVRTHLDDGPPAIIEGDFLLPARLAPCVQASHGRVRALFLYDGVDQIATNFASRSDEPTSHLERASVSAAFGEWLRGEALLVGLDAQCASPWATLLDRVCALTDSS